MNVLVNLAQKKMKKLITIVSVLLIGIMSPSKLLSEDKGVHVNSTIKIEVSPRDEETIPFSCNIENGIFYISFERDLGLVDISISAVGGGIVANHSIDSSVGDVEIVLPEQTGCYQITIITNEKIYTGNLYY